MLAASFVMTAAACSVNPDELRRIAVTTQPNRISYFAGERFDSAGMVVTAELRGSTRRALDFTVTPDRELTVADTSVTVSYTHGGRTRTANVAISVRVLERDQATISRVRAFIANTLNVRMPSDVSDIANELVDGIFGSEELFADRFLTMLAQAFLSNEEINGILDFVEELWDVESDIWDVDYWTELFLAIADSFNEIAVPNNKIAAFMWAVLVTIDEYASAAENALIELVIENVGDQEEREMIIEMIEQGFEESMTILREILDMGAQEVQLVFAAALNLGSLGLGAFINNFDLFMSEDGQLPTRNEFIDLVMEAREDVLSALTIMDASAMKVFINLAKIISAPIVNLSIDMERDWMEQDLVRFNNRLTEWRADLEYWLGEIEYWQEEMDFWFVEIDRLQSLIDNFDWRHGDWNEFNQLMESWWNASDMHWDAEWHHRNAVWARDNVNRDIDWAERQIVWLENNLDNRARIDAKDFFGIADEAVADWDYLRNSIIASVRAVNANLAGELFDAIENYDDDRMMIIFARVLNAGLTAANGVTSARANSLTAKYVDMFVATGVADVTVAEIMELVGANITDFYRDTAIIASRPLNYYLGQAYDSNLFVLVMWGEPRYAPPAHAFAGNRTIARVFDDGWVSSWTSFGWNATDFRGVAIPNSSHFRDAEISLGYIRSGRLNPVILTLNGTAVSGYVFISWYGNSRFIFVYGNPIQAPCYDHHLINGDWVSVPVMREFRTAIEFFRT